MIYPSLNELLSKVDDKYTLVVETAKRARKLISGDKPYVNIDSDKPVTIAIHEINMGKVRYKRTKEGIK